MKNVITIFCLMGLSISSHAQQFSINENKMKSLDSLFKITFAPSEPGAIVILAKDGKPIFKKAYGMSNLELNVPLNTDQKMGIGSISKQFAAVSILLLQQEGKLNIKDDVRKYLPQYNTWGRNISIEQMLSHTSGIPSYTELPGFDTLADKKIPISKLVAFFEKSPLVYEPGTNWSYSNSGFVLAALIVEKISGKPFNDFVKERIFNKVLMTESTFGTSDYIIPNKTGEYGGTSPKGKIKMEPQYDWYWAYGAGQIVSTVDDMLKWDEGLYNASFIDPKILSLGHTSYILNDGKPAGYGLGWAVEKFGNKTMVQHGGSIGGYRSQGMRIPEDHVYFLVMSNTGATNSSLIANKALSIVYDMPAIKEQRKDIQSWKEIEGVYESPSSGLRLQKNFGNIPAFYTVRVDSANRVTAQRTSSAAIQLSAAGKDILYDKSNPFSEWKIVRDDAGKVSGILFTHFFPGYGPERFNKRVSDALPPMKAPVKTDSVSLAKYVGLYEHEFGSRTKIAIEKNQLWMVDPEFNTKTELHWLKDNTFWIKEQDREVIFDVNKKGQVTGLQTFTGFQQIAMSKIVDLY